MSAFDRVLEGIKQVLLVSEDIKRLSEGVKELSREVRELDRRVARIEGIVEVAKTQASTRRRLPKGG
ncbi:MAG: hypothetical protein IVW51_10515 [Thermaceae bacterium]|nr:hypothetical protein [Thermaceae bacterium]